MKEEIAELQRLQLFERRITKSGLLGGDVRDGVVEVCCGFRAGTLMNDDGLIIYQVVLVGIQLRTVPSWRASGLAPPYPYWPPTTYLGT